MVNVDFPKGMINLFDGEAARLGIPRQSLIKAWISQAIGHGRQMRLISPAIHFGQMKPALLIAKSPLEANGGGGWLRITIRRRTESG
jgi:hypothetical protein